MIIFFHGTETLQPHEKIAALRERFLAKNPSGAGARTVTCTATTPLRTVDEALFATSLFTQRRMVVVRNPFALPAPAQRTLAARVPQIAPEDVVIFWEAGAVRTNAVLYKQLVAHAQKVKAYALPTRASYAAWVCARVQALAPHVQPDAAALALLAERAGGSLWQTDAVLRQAIAYSDGDTITAETIALFTREQPEAQAFRTVEAATAGNRRRAVALLRAQLATGEDAFKLFGLYAYHIRTLLAVADGVARGTDGAAIATAAGIKPFAVNKARRVLARMPLARVRRAHKLLVHLDRRVKNGALTMDDALYEFVVRM